MKHGRITNVPKLKRSLSMVYTEAFMNCHLFRVDKKGSRFVRESTNVSFNEVLKIFLKNKHMHWTILYRDNLIESDVAYWEFGGCTLMEKEDLFVWINVRLDLAEKIFEKYGLTIDWY